MARFAVLIPARDESTVIEELLVSLEKQSVKVGPEDVYVIVETDDDPTVEICRKHGVQVFVRAIVTPERARKGFALDEVLRKILMKQHYDLYFIFDADNILTDTFIEEMLKCYAAGYDIATGYRNAKNGNANVVAGMSCLTFSMVNTLVNRSRVRKGENVVFSGTGYYIRGGLIDAWKGWPFRSLTEDYEISLYATLRGLRTYYNEDAVFYDEQPTKYAQTVAQRVRWIKGYFSVRREYVPKMRKRMRAKNVRNRSSLQNECRGVRPAIWGVMMFVTVAMGAILVCIWNGRWRAALGVVGIAVLMTYVGLLGLVVYILRHEKLDLTQSMRIKIGILGPWYLATYVPCAMKALLKRKVAWVKIEHGNTMRLKKRRKA